MELNWEQAVGIFKNAANSQEAKHFTGARRSDQKAWASPQRDLVNLMPSILNATCALSQFALNEDEQEALGKWPAELYAAAASQTSGAAYMLPAMTAKSMKKAPEATSKFLACFGLATLMVQGLLPVFSVKQDGTPSEDFSPDTALTAAMCSLDEGTQNRIRKKLARLHDYSTADLLSPAFQSLADELSEAIDLTEEEENNEQQ